MQRETLKRLAAKQELSPAEIEAFISAISRDEVSDATIAALLMGLLSKGVSTRETVAIARAMRAHYVPVRPRIKEDLLDTCGTGGGLTTFNISTATAIVCAAAGIPVAKHGSRSLSSPSGSADVLEALGVKIDLPAPAIERMIEDIGIAFIHAPNFHPMLIRKVFSGQLKGAARNAIILNSAGASIVGGRAADFREGVALAADLIDTGTVSRKLGCPWRDIPDYFGRWNSIYKKFNQWSKKGEWLSVAAAELIEKLPSAEAIMADKGYDSKKIRAQIEAKGARAVIPRKSNSLIGNDGMDWALYKYRHLVENSFARLKHFRAIATRYEKLKVNFQSMVAMACAFLWLPM